MKMFNRIFDVISSLNNNIVHLIDCYKREHDEVIRTYDNYRGIIQEQDRIIQSLLKSQTSNKDIECMVFVPYRGKPVVIKNGEVVSTDNMTSFDVDWAYDRRTDVTVRGE